MSLRRPCTCFLELAVPWELSRIRPFEAIGACPLLGRGTQWVCGSQNIFPLKGQKSVQLVSRYTGPSVCFRWVIKWSYVCHWLNTAHEDVFRVSRLPASVMHWDVLLKMSIWKVWLLCTLSKHFPWKWAACSLGAERIFSMQPITPSRYLCVC